MNDTENKLAAMGLSLSAVFVPFSQSRNKAEKRPSLNWVVTLKKSGRDVIETDYMQGTAHCPAYKNPVKFNSGKRDEWSTNRAIAGECETGKRVRHVSEVFGPMIGAAIEPPSLADVVHCLLLDSSAVDLSGFEEWCQECGYDSDSIKVRGVYDVCLSHGLKMRSALGDESMRELRELFQDY